MGPSSGNLPSLAASLRASAPDTSAGKEMRHQTDRPDASVAVRQSVAGYGRGVAFAFMFPVGRFAFEFAFAFMFVFVAGVLVGIGVGVDTFVLRLAFALLAVLFVAASPQATPRAPRAKTAVSAIFFIILDYSPVFFKV